MIKYGINVDLVRKLIDKSIMRKTDLFDSYEINMDDIGARVFIFFTFYFDNKKLASFEKEYYENLDEVPEEEYIYCHDYIRTEMLYAPIHRLLFSGMGLDKKKYRISVETYE